MKLTLQLLLIVLTLICCSTSGFAQELNAIRIGNCSSAPNITNAIATEVTDGLVMDARPFAINQSKGKLLFTRGDGRVSVIHMNPFKYNYKISVAQEELVSTAVTDFLKLILPPSLLKAGELQTGEATKTIAAADGLRLLEERLSRFNPATCTKDPDACAATTEMLRVFNRIKASVNPTSAAVSPLFATLDRSTIYTPAGVFVGNTNDLYTSYTKAVTELRDEQLHTYDVCHNGELINARLGNYDFTNYFRALDNAQKEISRINSLATDLEQLASDYAADTQLKEKIVRCSGFNCATQFAAYAREIQKVLGTSDYQAKLTDLRQKGEEMNRMFLFTEQLRSKPGMFARTFTISKKFELSQATISVVREDLKPADESTAGRTQSGKAKPSNASGGGGSGNGGGGENTEGTIGDKFGKPVNTAKLQNETSENTEKKDDGGDKPANSNALVAQVNEVVQLGRPKFTLSGGMVFSPLPRRTFKSVKGFVLDAQGNPTGNGDADVIGLDENSPRRLFPMVFLNSRILSYDQGSLYFSIGVTGKHDDNVDLEYLFGPSVSFLNDRALFTFGAYGGLTQNLVSDVKVGDAIPDSLGDDAKFYRKKMTWKPGFSFSYSFSRPKKADAAGSGGGDGGSSNDFRDEIRIGSIPFNLALGLAFTSLEQRTYDAIAGFARDRMGNLTNGQTLTRIVGLTSSSNYRLSPMAMLHTRLTNFGDRDFYFTSGITGKKTDDDFDMEYLLGGSVNLYKRKVFLTFGTFIGKQQVLGGNFFEGSALDKSQGVTTTNRYVWKPAISFSYDISRIIPRSDQK